MVNLLKRWVLFSVCFWVAGTGAAIFYPVGQGIVHAKMFPGGGSDDHLPAHLARTAPQGWALAEAVERFSPENLWRQINGRAEFFLSYGMEQMTFALYARSSDPETFIEVSIYNMANPTYAFGAFSTERPQEFEPLDLGRGGYRAGSSLFFWKGAYYVRMIASEDDAGLQAVNLKLSENIADLLHDSGEAVWGLAILPKADRVPGSERYFRRDAMGLDFLQNTYLAQYRKKGSLITVFLLKEENAAAAGNVLGQYAAYVKQFGEGLGEITREGVKIILCDMGGGFDALFQKGALVGGVTAVEDRDLAVDAALDIRQQLNAEPVR